MLKSFLIWSWYYIIKKQNDKVNKIHKVYLFKFYKIKSDKPSFDKPSKGKQIKRNMLTLNLFLILYRLCLPIAC